MSLGPESFSPVPTDQVPRQAWASTLEQAPGVGGVPRILLRAGAQAQSQRNVVWLGGLYLGISALLLGVLFGMPRPLPIVVYQEPPGRTLLGGLR